MVLCCVVLVNDTGVVADDGGNDVPNIGFKTSEGGFGGFPGLGVEEESVNNVNWKVPMLTCASVIIVVSSLIFAVVRKSHREDQNKLVNNYEDDDLFVGELMENDPGSFKRSGDGHSGNNPLDDIEQGSSTCGSSDPSNSFSDAVPDLFIGELIENDPGSLNRSDGDGQSGNNASGGIEQGSSACSSSYPSNPYSDVVSKASTNSSIPSSPEESPGNHTKSKEDEELPSFSLQSVASSSMDGTMSPNPTITPSECSDVLVYEHSDGSTCDSLGNDVRTRLSLDDYDVWLSTVAESEDEISKSDTSSLNEVMNDDITPIGKCHLLILDLSVHANNADS